jgi:hypothetical protein
VLDDDSGGIDEEGLRLTREAVTAPNGPLVSDERVPEAVTAGEIERVGGGAILTETVFSLNGVGAYAISSIVAKDLPVVLGVTLLGAVFIVVCNLIVDLLYPIVDPRVRIAG